MRKFIKIVLYLQELLSDVRIKTYYTGKGQVDNVEHRAFVQENGDEENADIIIRSFSNAIGRASSVISEYAPIERESSSNALSLGSEDIILMISMPQNFNEGMTNTLAQILHEYLVNSAIGDWFVQVMPAGSGMAQAYAQASQANLIELRHALTRRLRPARSELIPDIVPSSNPDIESGLTTATLTFANSSGTIAIGDTYTNQVTTNSDGTISYASSDETVATIDENGKVTAIKAGSVVITASIPATTQYTAVTTTYSLAVSKAVPTLTVTMPDSVKVGFTANITATTNSDATITFATSNIAVATVSSTGVITAVGAGTCTMYITVSETDNYKAASRSYLYTVTALAPGDIDADGKVVPLLAIQDAPSIYVGATPASYTFKTDSNSTLTVTSSDTTVATVGTPTKVSMIDTYYIYAVQVKGIKIGSFTLTATMAANGTFAESKITKSIRTSQMEGDQ